MHDMYKYVLILIYFVTVSNIIAMFISAIHIDRFMIR